MKECNPCNFPMEPKLKLGKDEGVPVNATMYRSIVESLWYLTHTRPDLAYTVRVVSKYMERPTELHQQALKHILRYVAGTIDHGLVYTRREEATVLTGYSDSNLAGDVDDRRSTSGVVFYFYGNVITWSSQKQRSVAMSSCEDEFMAATTTTC